MQVFGKALDDLAAVMIPFPPRPYFQAKTGYHQNSSPLRNFLLAISQSISFHLAVK